MINKRINGSFILERDIDSSTQTDTSKDKYKINILKEQEKLKNLVEIQNLLLEILSKKDTGGNK